MSQMAVKGGPYPGCVTSLHRLTTPLQTLPPGLFMHREHGPFKPMPLQRVMHELGPLDPESLLLGLPLEVLEIISSFLERDCLSSLALASRHCLQLSRAVRFADFWLDYSPRAYAFLAELQKEATEDVTDCNKSSLPSLGCCVRRLYMCTFVEFMEERHHVDLQGRPQGEMAIRLAKANDAYYDDYLPAIEYVLSNAVPHLEVLVWEDLATIPPSCLTAIASSSLKRLSLRRTRVEGDFFSQPIVHSAKPMQLQYLQLDNVATTAFEHRASDLCWNLLSLNACTLQELDLSGLSLGLQNPIQQHLPLLFPQLRIVHISVASEANSDQFMNEENWNILMTSGKEIKGDLMTLLGISYKSRITTLSLGHGIYSTQALSKPLHLSELRVLVDGRRAPFRERDLRLISKNPQISKLSIRSHIPADLLINSLLPLLIDDFSQLRSLDICCEDLPFPTEGLHMIAKIRSLTQLRLGAGKSSGHKGRWMPDHHAVRFALSVMPDLRRLAFLRDYYSPSNDLPPFGEHVDDYYELEAIVPADEEEVRLYASIPEDRQTDTDAYTLTQQPVSSGFLRVHMHRMTAEANLYAQHLSQVEWLYVGQRCFSFRRKYGKTFEVVVESDHVLDPYALKMFTQDQ